MMPIPFDLLPANMAELRSRAQTLLDYMLKEGPEHFDMRDWFIMREEPDDDGYGECETLGPKELTDEATSACGFAACMAGNLYLAFNKPVALTSHAWGVGSSLSPERCAWFLGMDRTEAFYAYAWRQDLMPGHDPATSQNHWEWFVVIEALKQVIQGGEWATALPTRYPIKTVTKENYRP